MELILKSFLSNGRGAFHDGILSHPRIRTRFSGGNPHESINKDVFAGGAK
jgi:hypothetical protein